MAAEKRFAIVTNPPPAPRVTAGSAASPAPPATRTPARRRGGGTGRDNSGTSLKQRQAASPSTARDETHPQFPQVPFSCQTPPAPSRPFPAGGPAPPPHAVPRPSPPPSAGAPAPRSPGPAADPRRCRPRFYLRGSRVSAGWRWRTAPGSACCTDRQREQAAW